MAVSSGLDLIQEAIAQMGMQPAPFPAQQPVGGAGPTIGTGSPDAEDITGGTGEGGMPMPQSQFDVTNGAGQTMTMEPVFNENGDIKAFRMDPDGDGPGGSMVTLRPGTNDLSVFMSGLERQGFDMGAVTQGLNAAGVSGSYTSGAGWSGGGGGGGGGGGAAPGGPSGHDSNPNTGQPPTPQPPAPASPQPQPNQPTPDPGDVSVPPPLGVGGTAGGSTFAGAVQDPGAGAAMSGAGATPESLFDFLDMDRYNAASPEERMQMLIGAVVRRQEQGLGAQLGRIDAGRQDWESRRQGTRNLEDTMLGDTDVMSEANIQRIAGATTQAANQKASVLGRAMAERRAAAGSSRTGSAMNEQQQVLQQALNTAVNAESDIRAGARRENFQSRAATLAGVGQSQRADAAVGQQYAGMGATAIGNQQVEGTGFLTTNALNRNAPIRVAHPGSFGTTYEERNPYG